jgi:acylphosphatase
VAGKPEAAMSKKKTARKYLISGRVQGVGYRFFAEEHAVRLGLGGYVKNLWDGNVEVYAIGDESRLEEFKRHLAEGPRSARVTGIEESEQPVNNRYTSFVVEGGW